MQAEFIAKALGGHKVGDGWGARCPAHDDHNPSLSVRDSADGKVLVRCHAGCDQSAVISALRSRGLWTASGRCKPGQSSNDSVHNHQESPDDHRRAELASAIWRSTTPATGSLIENYLASRGLDITPPSRLRFHGGLMHPKGEVWPAMVALVTRGTDDTPMAIHRTFLARNGGSKAPVEPQKMMLGPCRGGAVRLGKPSDVLMVGEGIETCLAAMLSSDHPAWAALSTSGLRTLDLPDDCRDVIILADGDGAGESAAEDCGQRWKREGRRVRVARPPQGLDFNDMLLIGVQNTEDGAR